MSDKMDFKLRIASSVFFDATAITSDLFSQLLAGQELSAMTKMSLQGPPISQVII